MRRSARGGQAGQHATGTDTHDNSGNGAAITADAQTLPGSGVFQGIVTSDARLRAGSSLEVKGIIGGDLIVEDGAEVVVSGMVDGRVRFADAKV